MSLTAEPVSKKFRKSRLSYRCHCVKSLSDEFHLDRARVRERGVVQIDHSFTKVYIDMRSFAGMIPKLLGVFDDK